MTARKAGSLEHLSPQDWKSHARMSGGSTRLFAARPRGQALPSRQVQGPRQNARGEAVRAAGLHARAGEGGPSHAERRQ